MEILLIRHGQSQGDILGVCEGRADLQLTDKGLEQAEKLADWLKANEEIEIIMASPLKRAKKVAELIQSKTACDLVYDDLLMEWNNGLLAGLKREVADEKYPIPQGGRQLHHTLYETESLINFRARAETFVSILKSKGLKKVCIVSHGGMINELLSSFLKLPLEGPRFSCHDTCVHKLTLKERPLIHYLNKTEHLL